MLIPGPNNELMTQSIAVPHDYQSSSELSPVSITVTQAGTTFPGNGIDIKYGYFFSHKNESNDSAGTYLVSGSNLLVPTLGISYISFDDVDGERISFDNVSECGEISYYGDGLGFPGIQEIYFPVLEYVAGNLVLEGSNVTSISIPLLKECGFDLGIAVTSITTLDLSSLESVYSQLLIQNNPQLTDISLNSIINIGSDINFGGNALSESCVDAILVKLASLDGSNGTTELVDISINLSGGTNSAPTQTGTDAITILEGRGCTVNTN